MATIRELETQPCRFMLKLLPAKQTTIPNPEANTNIQASETPGKRKVRKIIQRVDEQGNPLMKTITIEHKKGCGCKANKQTITTETKQVPDTIEVWVEEDIPVIEQTAPIPPATIQVNEKQALCKMYGTVSLAYCQRCKTYTK
jgi:hypothetical protein